LVSGILNINKPAGLTSHDVINEVRKILKTKKAGHTGTLDPAVTGVLAICIGSSTRIIPYLPGDKEYISEITLGTTTSSYDIDGEVTETKEVTCSENEIIEAINSFKGTIQQQVPLTSATHYKGKKLYEYAHKGIVIDDLPVKSVTVHNIEILKLPENNDNIIKIKILCSSGTYIRCIANDLGKKLGCGAFSSKLIRSQASGLTLETSITLEELANKASNNELNDVLNDPVKLIELPKYVLTELETKKILLGQFIGSKNETFNDNQEIMLINSDNQLMGIGKFSLEKTIIKPAKVLITS
jgi:tRNA pseudouridine55 synthase